MSSRGGTLIVAFGLAALISGCASIPRSTLPASQFASLDCVGVADQLNQAQTTKVDAARARRTAWKGILPLAIGIRYVRASRFLKEAQRRETALLRQGDDMRCGRSTS